MNAEQPVQQLQAAESGTFEVPLEAINDDERFFVLDAKGNLIATNVVINRIVNDRAVISSVDLKTGGSIVADAIAMHRRRSITDK